MGQDGFTTSEHITVYGESNLMEVNAGDLAVGGLYVDANGALTIGTDDNNNLFSVAADTGDTAIEGGLAVNGMTYLNGGMGSALNMGDQDIYDARGLRFEDYYDDAPSYVCDDDMTTPCSSDVADSCGEGVECVAAQGPSNRRYRIYAANGKLYVTSGLSVSGKLHLPGGLGSSLNMSDNEAYNVRGLRFTDYYKVCANDNSVICTAENAATQCGEDVDCVVNPDSEGWSNKYRIYAHDGDLQSLSGIDAQGTLTGERLVAQQDGFNHFQAEGVRGTVAGTENGNGICTTLNDNDEEVSCDTDTDCTDQGLGNCRGATTWYRIAHTDGSSHRVGGQVQLRNGVSSSHANVTFMASGSYSNYNHYSFSLLNNGKFANSWFEAVRIVGRSGNNCPVPNPDYDPDCVEDSDAGVTCEPESSGTRYCSMYLEVAVNIFQNNDQTVYASFQNNGHTGDWVPEPWTAVSEAEQNVSSCDVVAAENGGSVNGIRCAVQ